MDCTENKHGAVVSLSLKKVIIAATIIFIIMANSVVFADPLSDKLKNEQQQLQQTRDTYDDLDNQIQQSESSIQKLDEQINDMYDQINETKTKIVQAEYDIKQLGTDIENSERDLKVEEDRLGKRIKGMYINGSFGYLSAILEATSFSDFFTRLELVSRIIQNDYSDMKEIKAKNDEIVSKKQSLLDEKNKLLALQQDNESKLADIKNKKDAQQAMAVDLKNKQKSYASRVSQYQELVNATLKQIKAMKQPESGKKSSPQQVASRGGGQSISNDAIVSYAANFLGVRYVWGGNTPSGFDCSGFTKYVFAHFGISLQRRASEQATQGTRVSMSDLQPGDLVFFGNPVYHVGIYVGNGCFIHAPETGEVVKISPLKWMNFSGARRVK